MIRPSKAVIAGAAVAGLLTGSFAVRAYAASTMTSHAGVALHSQTMADAEKGTGAAMVCTFGDLTDVVGNEREGIRSDADRGHGHGR